VAPGILRGGRTAEDADAEARREAESRIIRRQLQPVHRAGVAANNGGTDNGALCGSGSEGLVTTAGCRSAVVLSIRLPSSSSGAIKHSYTTSTTLGEVARALQAQLRGGGGGQQHSQAHSHSVCPKNRLCRGDGNVAEFLEPGSWSFFTTYPRKELCEETTWSCTLGELGLGPRAALVVGEKEKRR
jgi:hypothetical protein